MLERVSANLSFALDNFDHEAARKDGERAMRRLNRMFGASAPPTKPFCAPRPNMNSISEFAMPPSTAEIRCHRRAAGRGGSTWLKPVAGTGESFHLITRSRFSIDPDNDMARAFPVKRSGRSGPASTTTWQRPFRAALGKRLSARPA